MSKKKPAKPVTAAELPAVAEPQPVVNKGRFKPKLDEAMKDDILTILRLGCSRYTAAAYVGCCADTIRRTANRDPKFKADLESAESKFEVKHAGRVDLASKETRYWMASRWCLERKFPNRYGERKPDTITPEEAAKVLHQFAEVIAQEVPKAANRNKILERLRQLIDKVEFRKPPAEADHAS